jgi:hypothetical protein
LSTPDELPPEFNRLVRKYGQYAVLQLLQEWQLPSTGSIFARRTPSKARSRRTVRSKRFLSNRTAFAMIFKLAEAAEKNWRRLDGQN